MVASNANPIELSKARIAELQDGFSTRLEALKLASLRRAQIAVGTVRDSGMALTYSTSAAAAASASRISRTLPLGQSLAKALTKQSDALTAREASLRMPSIAGYDELNVKEVADALEGLDAWELTKARNYETAHKNRKTVLGAIERLLR